MEALRKCDGCITEGEHHQNIVQGEMFAAVAKPMDHDGRYFYHSIGYGSSQPNPET